MTVNQPPIKENPTESSWDLEVTREINITEERLNAVLRAIRDATDLDDLKERTREL